MNLPDSMYAMVLEAANHPLIYKKVPVPHPAPQEVLIKVIACGVCRTDLHIADGELKHPALPLIPGHEITGIIVKAGAEVTLLKEGDTVGVPWLGYTCGHCRYCIKGQENLCENAKFTGYSIDGGYAEYTVAHQHYCFPLPSQYANPSGAPLLCAGLIGYRSYRKISKQANKIGIYGFGGAAHILTQVAVAREKEIYAFTSPGDTAAQKLAKKLGAVWAGDSIHPSPVKLDAAIIFAPVGKLIPKALADTDKGGTVICGGIHMSDIPAFPYDLLWEERTIASVANLTRLDGEEFLALAPEIPVRTEITVYKLEEANKALEDLRHGNINGAAVLAISE
jgi:propanol-preferring alcohol dehydrogenase